MNGEIQKKENHLRAIKAPDRVKVADGHNDALRKQQFCNLLFKN